MPDLAVLGTTMHYVERGTGRPVVFLHGNPTSSYLWRDVLPSLDDGGRRLIAVDLIGMGESGKPDLGYRLADHVDHVEAFLEALGESGLTLVAHDWGVAISLEYLRRHPERVDAVAIMEGHVRPVPYGVRIFPELRTPGLGERLALGENFFLETVLPAGMHRTLTAAELEVYRRPYPDRVSRWPLLRWAREIPIDGEPADVVELLAGAWAYFAASPVRKLLVYGQPGAVIDADAVAWCRRTVPDLDLADVGAASHFLPEDRPREVAAALDRWLRHKS